MEELDKALTNWAPIVGRWRLEGESVTYLGPGDPDSPAPYGIALSKARIRSGSIETSVRFFEKAKEFAGRVILGYNPETKEYLSSGLGGYGCAYVMAEFLSARGWRALGVAGNVENLAPDSEFHIETRIHGQRASLVVDGITVVVHNLSRPLGGDQVGLFAWGPGPVEFKATKVAKIRPKAFVVMQFGEPYDALWREVIQPISQKAGLETYRADEVYRPGIVLQDIIRGIVEAEVIIAEITPPNPNVFYEIGYAHAMGKTTILLAERGEKLPFDIRGYRCIFYDNTIRGKTEVENELRKHLASILQDA